MDIFFPTSSAECHNAGVNSTISEHLRDGGIEVDKTVSNPYSET
ncbi:hypothetical protein SAMN06296036_14719 [Pseudobacteriovorax antillogorgiicola]|uniref:Uncharacterized protein n=1 Tax=Pseudobacteriovorax antillogorgiicola TaxID=1513793 RepID=A0A1Y6CR29_9BACT|nr:hypothetical protein EDD56_1462 [Pseudobacteriovorax antillogorgiicola]SMF83516.1 hypothetical protein SAMN06296036_14719 [Pseudobacteriovorax antillogorgiicola]